MSERPRVLQMGPDPGTGGGMAAALRGLLSSPLVDRYELDVAPTYRRSQPFQRLAVYCAALVRLVAWSLRNRGRIVHVHATVRGSMYRKSVCVLLAKALRRRVVLHIHSGAGDIAAFRADRGRYSLVLFRAAFDASDTVLAVSRASADALRLAYGVTGIEVVPNPAPLVPAFQREDSGLDRVRVAYLGGFANPAKGGDVMLEALALVLPRAPAMRITLAGPGELPPAGAELVACNPSVEWVGWLGSEEKDDLLRAAEIFALSSRSEGMPMALLEAMAYGMAIVATEVGGIPEMLESGNEALLVAPEQPAALAEALYRLAVSPRLRRQLAQRACERAERRDAVEIADRLAILYAALT